MGFHLSVPLISCCSSTDTADYHDSEPGANYRARSQTISYPIKGHHQRAPVGFYPSPSHPANASQSHAAPTMTSPSPSKNPAAYGYYRNYRVSSYNVQNTRTHVQFILSSKYTCAVIANRSVIFKNLFSVCSCVFF